MKRLPNFYGVPIHRKGEDVIYRMVFRVAPVGRGVLEGLALLPGPQGLKFSSRSLGVQVPSGWSKIAVVVSKDGGKNWTPKLDSVSERGRTG